MSVSIQRRMAADLPMPQTDEDVTVGLRKAALLLHSVSLADRQWLLGRMDTSQRAQLSSLIEEIDALGIPADRTLLHDVLELPRGLTDSLVEPENTERLDDLEHLLRVIDAAAPAWLAQILRDEPVELIASLLEMHEWSWRHAMLGQLGVVKRRQIEDLSMSHRVSASVPPAPALRTFLLSAIAKRLEVLQHAQHVAGQPAVRQTTRRLELVRGWRRLIAWRRLSKALS